MREPSETDSSYTTRWDLTKRYGDERLGAACQRALASGAISYTSVKSILAQNLDRAPLPAASPAPAPAEHENLRGAGYYAQGSEEKEA